VARARRPQCPRRRRGPGALALSASVTAWLLAAAVCPQPAGAQEGGEAAAPAAKTAPEEAAPPVHLDQLLKLPDQTSYTMDKRGGLSRGEWRDLFQRVRGQLDQEKKALTAAEARMDQVARGKNPWKVGPQIPGFSSGSDAPMDYELQREIKARRASVHDLEEQLRQLNIKADLAGVPADWRS
jgi:TolA-binding protein